MILRFKPDCILRDKREDTTGAQRHHKCMNIVPHVSSLAHGPLAFHVACICKVYKINFLFQKSIVAGKSLCLKKVLSCTEWSLSREDRELQLINWSYKRMLHWFIVKFSGSFLVDTKVFEFTVYKLDLH